MSGPLRITCLEEMLGDVPLGERFARARAAGFDGVDLRGDHLPRDTSAARVAVAETGLPVVTVYGRLPGPLLAATARERADAVEVVRGRLEDAAGVGAGRLVLVPVFGDSRISVPEPEEPELGELVVLLAELAPVAEDAHVEVVLEPLNRTETHLLRSPAQAARVARGVGSPWVGTMLDTYHADREGQDMGAEIEAAGDRLRLVHLSDRDRKLPGEGGIDFAQVLGALDAAGYAGFCGLECRGSFEVERLRRSVAWLREQAATVAAGDPSGGDG